MREEVVKYQEKYKITYEIAERRLNAFSKLEKLELKTRLCPKCNEYSVTVDDAKKNKMTIHTCCTNKNVPKVDSEGTKYFEPCDYEGQWTLMQRVMKSMLVDLPDGLSSRGANILSEQTWLDLIEHNTSALEEYIEKMELTNAT